MPWLSPLSNPLGGHFWTLRPYLSRRYLAQRFAWPFTSVRGAGPPEPDTLLWYRLACTLPDRLPPEALSEASAEERPAIQEDYGVIRQGLGGCPRARATQR